MELPAWRAKREPFVVSYFLRMLDILEDSARQTGFKPVISVPEPEFQSGSGEGGSVPPAPCILINNGNGESHMLEKLPKGLPDRSSAGSGLRAAVMTRTHALSRTAARWLILTGKAARPNHWTQEDREYCNLSPPRGMTTRGLFHYHSQRAQIVESVYTLGLATTPQIRLPLLSRPRLAPPTL
jgi:hypothetical protein